MKKGNVALVGAGPGLLGLLTIRGKELIESADVVVYDRLVSDDILSLIPASAKKINVGKKSSNHLVPQNEINQILLEEALAGNKVVRLKGGDPFVFGRGGEELEMIVENGISFEVVPGITSSIAAPSFAGIPVTHRDFCSSFHVITGHQKENEPLRIDFDTLAKLNATLVFLMGVASLSAITKGLMDAGMDKNTPAAIVEKGTYPTQRKVISTLENLYSEAAAKKISSPSIIIVGKVCTLSNEYDWFSARPLFGKKFIVTRPTESENTLSKKLKNLGADVFDMPCIKIEKLCCEDKLSKAINSITKYSWLVFTSKNGVQIFFEQLRAEHEDCRLLGLTKVAAVGSQTANELLKYGIIADYVPEIYDGEHLGEGLVRLTAEDENILLVRAENGSPDILTKLDEAGRSYTDIGVYTTETISYTDSDIDELALENEKVYVTFTSASTVEGFAKNTEETHKSKVFGICIGRQTAQKAEEYGFSHVVSAKATIDSMIEKILEIV